MSHSWDIMKAFCDKNVSCKCTYEEKIRLKGATDECVEQHHKQKAIILFSKDSIVRFWCSTNLGGKVSFMYASDWDGNERWKELEWCYRSCGKLETFLWWKLTWENIFANAFKALKHFP